jgi:hypothetical protein
MNNQNTKAIILIMWERRAYGEKMICNTRYYSADLTEAYGHENLKGQKNEKFDIVYYANCIGQFDAGNGRC